MTAQQLFVVWGAMCLGNVIANWGQWEVAAERSYFMGAAVFMVGLIQWVHS